MDEKNFIESKIAMINDGFGLSQTRDEVWQYVLKSFCGVLRIEAMISRSMELYAEILKRVETRKKWLEEIKAYVAEQGTLVQDDFEQVPVHHLTKVFKIKEKDILYIGADAVYFDNGNSLRFSELSDDDINIIYSFLIH